MACPAPRRAHHKRLPSGNPRAAHTNPPSPAKSGIIQLLGTGWQRIRFRLDSPRAAAHVWGKRARILTEINRLPQSSRPLQQKVQPAEKPRRTTPETVLAHLPATRSCFYQLDARRPHFDARIAPFSTPPAPALGPLFQGVPAPRLAQRPVQAPSPADQRIPRFSINVLMSRFPCSTATIWRGLASGR